jgi:ech hydrogenase subunit D
MSDNQTLHSINRDELITKVTELFNTGYRIVQIGCTTINDTIEVNYSFDKDYNFINLKIILQKDDLNLPSISKIYFAAFLYENEIHDLFGITVKDNALDYKGNFYKTVGKFPFGIK